MQSVTFDCFKASNPRCTLTQPLDRAILKGFIFFNILSFGLILLICSSSMWCTYSGLHKPLKWSTLPFWLWLVSTTEQLVYITGLKPHHRLKLMYMSPIPLTTCFFSASFNFVYVFIFCLFTVLLELPDKSQKKKKSLRINRNRKTHQPSCLWLIHLVTWV